jgi:hypothetical protein
MPAKNQQPQTAHWRYTPGNDCHNPIAPARGAIANKNTDNFACVYIHCQPNPLLIAFVTNKRPHLIALDRQSPFFFGQTSTVFETDQYDRIDIWKATIAIDSPVTLAIPAKDNLSSSKLSIRTLVSCPITFFVWFWTNCLRQPLHLKFCRPLWIVPFFTTSVDWHRGQTGCLC